MIEIKYIFGYAEVEVLARGDPYSECVIKRITKGSKYKIGEIVEVWNRSLYPKHGRGGKLYGKELN